MFNMSFFPGPGPSNLTGVIWQFPTAQHKTGIDSEHCGQLCLQTSQQNDIFVFSLYQLWLEENSGFWQQIWKEKRKVIHNWGKSRWMQSKGDMQGDLWRSCKCTQWHKSMAGHPGFQDSQPLNVRKPSDRHRITIRGAKGGTPNFMCYCIFALMYTSV